MKKLVLFSLIVATVSQAAGCIISSDNGGGTNGYITANWDIKSVDGTSLQCPAGFDTAALYSQEIDSNYGNVGGVITGDLFDCAAFTGVSAPLAPTTYYSWIQIESHDGSQVYATTVQAFVDLTLSDKTFNADIYDDGGYFQMAWQLTVGGSPSSCAANADITGVEAISTEVGNANNSVSDIFHCADHYGVTGVLPAGNYTISVDAFNASMAAVGTANPISKTIQVQNHVTDLGTVTIPLN
ncbi:MAG: hypothetical protein ABI591_15230 [Kofleriaceae bacterium]